MPQLLEDKVHFILQLPLRWASAHFLGNVRDYLTAKLPGRWIGCASTDNNPLFLWPPRSPNLIPCDFFLMGLH